MLAIRFPGKNAFLYIGRGHKYEGIFLGDSLPPSSLRIQDKFLDYLRKNIVGCRLGKMEVDNQQFFALFSFKNDQENNSISFGYKNHQLYFLLQNKDLIYTSWNNEFQSGKSILNLVDNFLADKSGGEFDKDSTWTLESYFKSEEKKLNGLPVQVKKEKFLVRKIKNIEADLLGVKKWVLLERDLLSENSAEIREDQTNFHGIKIKFPFGLNQWQKRDFLFQKIKKLKKAEVILSTRLAEAHQELEKVKAGDVKIELTRESAISLLWQTTRSKAKVESDKKWVQFKLSNITGSLGLDAQSNDMLRAESAKDHYWFHIENFTGSHCVLKTEDISHFTKEEFSAIASMLRDYSKLQISEIPVIFSQVKHVKGLKGSAGKVLLKKPKSLRCNYLDLKEIITII